MNFAARLRPLISEWLVLSLARARSDYFYPLSRVTYGTDEIVEAIQSMCELRTTMADKVRKFEAYFAEYVGARHAIMVNSGSSADLLLSLLLSASPLVNLDHEVLVPAVTWPTHVWSPLMCGFPVRLVDVDSETLNVSRETLERAVTPNSRALFLVHLLGNPCDMDEVEEFCREHDLTLLEDCCEALGAEWRGEMLGHRGIGGTFSFFFSHHLTTLEGGMVVTDDDAAADRLRLLREHGWRRSADARYSFESWGLNVRPTELQAAFGLHQLRRLPGYLDRRSRLADGFFAYVDAQEHLQRPRTPEAGVASWMALPVLVRPSAPFTRDELVAYLESSGVETRPIVAGNLARQPATKTFWDRLRFDDLSGADVVHDTGFFVGLSPVTTDLEMERLIRCFDDFLSRTRR